MKKIILTAVSALLVAASANAGFDLSTAYTSDYYFRGTQFADSMVETTLDYSVGDFSMGVWTANPFDAPDANEVDYYAGYGVALSEMVSMSLGACAYVFPDSGSESTYEWSVGFGFDTDLAPAVTFYYDTELEVFTFEGGIGHEFTVSDAAAIELGLTAGYVTPDEGDSAVYYLLSAGYSYAIGETASFSFSANYADGDDELSGGNWDDGFYFSFGFGASF